MHRSKRHRLAQYRDDALDLAPLAKANGVAQGAIVPSTRGCLDHGGITKGCNQVGRDLDAGDIGDVE